MLYNDFLDNTDGILREIFAVHEQIRDDVYAHVDIAQVKNVDENDLLVLRESGLVSKYACERAMSALVLWLAKGGQELELCDIFCSAMQEYFEQEQWKQDEALVLYCVLKTFAHYFPVLSLTRCDPDRMGQIENLVQAICSTVQKDIENTGIEVPTNAYWVLKSLYPLYDTSKGPVAGREIFFQTVQGMFEYFTSMQDTFRAGWIIQDIQECRHLAWPDKENMIRCVADLYFEQGELTEGIEGWHLLEQASVLYEKLSDYPMYDQCLRLIKDKKENFQGTPLGVNMPEELLDRLNLHCQQICEDLSEKKQGRSCFEMLPYFFGIFRLPSKDLTRKTAQNSLPISMHIFNTEYMTAARSGKVGDGTKGENEVDNRLEFCTVQTYLHSLPVFYSEMSCVWKWFASNYDQDELSQAVVCHYQRSLLYEEDRFGHVLDMNSKFLAQDWTGFMYPATLQIEHFLRVYLHKTGHNVTTRSLRKMENQSLGKILSNYEHQLEKQFGPDFMYFLWMLFGSEYGLNMRNALAHGLGLEYLNNPYYALFIWYALGYMWYHAPLVVGVRGNPQIMDD